MRLAHRVHTSATPAQVWEVLGDPQRWPQFDPTLRAVRGASRTTAAGQRLVGLSRMGALGIPLDVLEASPPYRLVVLVHTMPGLRQQVTTDVVPAARGGSYLTVAMILDGLLVWPALWPAWWTTALHARLLGHRADLVARAARRSA